MGNKIVSNGYTFTDSDLTSGDCYIGNSLAAEELSIDTLDFNAENIGSPVTEFIPSDSDAFVSRDEEELFCTNSMDNFAYGDEVRFYNNDLLFGKFYFEKSVRASATQYKFMNVSAMGLLDNLTHYGGIYDEVEAGVIIKDIMGSVPYSIDADVSSVTVSGWLAVATKRKNLQQVLFAIGAGVFKDSSGNIAIKFINSAVPTEISDSRIYLDGKVNFNTPCTEVDVTEHTYSTYSTDETVTLFDTSESVSSQLVTFDDPCHSLVATGLTVENSGVNYAVVSGVGTLKGQKYTHITRVISYPTGLSGTSNVVTVTDATLVSRFNSYNVAVRVAQYYSAVSTVSIGIIAGSERPGTQVSFHDPFGEQNTGYIKSMDIALSNVLKASIDIAVGFLPVGHGNNYNHYVVLTGAGNWTVPNEVTRIFAILVEGGTGGKGGHGGESGARYADDSVAAAGGDAGTAGSGGRILSTNLTVISGQVYSYSCGKGGTPGKGGVGGKAGVIWNPTPTPSGEGTPGGAGTATTFGALTSTSGIVYSTGYVEPKSGLLLGTPGNAGIAGGKGSLYRKDGDSITFDGHTYIPGAEGASILTVDHIVYFCHGGNGGGAAAGTNGGKGPDASYPATASVLNGTGGTGATPAFTGETSKNYGGGGSGGHGGGGGGEAGYFSDTAISNLGYYIVGGGNFGGNGGDGSDGGTGGDGVIVIYY